MQTLPELSLLQFGTAKTLRLLYNGKLSLLSAPAEIAFQPPALGVDPTILGRKDAVNVTVEDSRFISAKWFLYVYSDGDLTTSDKEHSLKGGLVFDDGSGNYKELTANPTLVFTGNGNEGVNFETVINWIETEGILLRLNNAIYVDKTYSTVIHWLLSDTAL